MLLNAIFTELTPLVVIDTDYIGTYKSNCHTTMKTTLINIFAEDCIEYTSTSFGRSRTRKQWRYTNSSDLLSTIFFKHHINLEDYYIIHYYCRKGGGLHLTVQRCFYLLIMCGSTTSIIQFSSNIASFFVYRLGIR